MKWLVGLVLVAVGWWAWSSTGYGEPSSSPTPDRTYSRYPTPSPYATPTSHPTYAPRPTVTPRTDPTYAPRPTYTSRTYPTYAPPPIPSTTFSEGSDEPWNVPGPDLDCVDIGHSVRITGPDYHNLDRDGDGIGCESYGY